MITFIEWLKLKAQEFDDNIYLIDPQETVTYAENFTKIQLLMSRLRAVPPASHVVFIGSGSVKAYQLYFAVIALQAVWVPFDYLLQKENLLAVLNQLKPSLIIYDKDSFDLQEYIAEPECNTIELAEIFSTLEQEKDLFEPFEPESDRIISGYLTSGSTGKPKIVMHGWYATLYHAAETVTRYQLTSAKRLFNPRLLCHVSGAFPLTTFMHCGGSIVIPSKGSYKMTEFARTSVWAEEMFNTPKITHVSFFPSEMQAYAALIENNPHLRPPALERITTGGEEVEFSDLVHISRAFATHRGYYDLMWWLYPLLGNSWSFELIKSFYEFCYGQLVQITQTYGATELICNAVANSPLSGPDPRGIGSAINSLHPEIRDDRGTILPQDGKAIGRLGLFGRSIATSYLYCQETNLSKHYYQTSDLASIQPNGCITLFGRSENLITLVGVENKINPVVMERRINKNSGKKSIVFEYNNRLHAAIRLRDKSHQQAIISSIKYDDDLSLISTISFWEAYPLLLGGKIDRKSIEKAVKENEKSVIDITEWKEQSFLDRYSTCQIL